MTTQLSALETYFKRSNSLTQHEATVELGIARLSERVRELEARGWVFLHNMIDVPTRYTKARVCQYVVTKRPRKSQT